MKKNPPIDFSFFKKKKVLIIAGLSMGILHLGMILIYKDRRDAFFETMTDIVLFFKKFIVNWLFVEALAIFILFYLTIRFQKFISKEYPRSLSEIIKTNLRYLLIILLSLVIFIPFAIFVRHIWWNGFTVDPERLIRRFGHFRRLFLETLLPFTVVAYTFFNSNLYLQAAKRKEIQERLVNTNENADVLEVINENGNIQIALSQILWIAKKDRSYEVKTAEKTYYVRKTLSELEDLLLPKGFIRINRSVLVNRAFVHNYSFWEYDKFILRMKDAALTEFIVSRKRMRQIKSQLTLLS